MTHSIRSAATGDINILDPKSVAQIAKQEKAKAKEHTSKLDSMSTNKVFVHKDKLKITLKEENTLCREM